MKKVIMVTSGVLIIIFSSGILSSGVVWPWGWGVGFVLILFGLFGDSSTPQNSPKSISQSFKGQVSADYEKAIEIISHLHKLQSPWVSKNDPAKLQEKILKMKNLSTASITYKYGESLITKLKLSFTKSKDTYMITISGEGKESLEFIQSNYNDI